MNEFKLRAFDKVHGKVRDVAAVHLIEQAVLLWIESGNVRATVARDINDVEFVRYTGLKDKNGTDIYEGHIVKNTYSNSEGFAYRCEYSDWIGGYLFSPFMLGDESAPLIGIEEFSQPWEAVNPCEGIGNIYEDSELLERSL